MLKSMIDMLVSCYPYKANLSSLLKLDKRNSRIFISCLKGEVAAHINSLMLFATMNFIYFVLSIAHLSYTWMAKGHTSF